MTVIPEPRVLILDDDMAHGNSVRDLLTLQEYRVETSCNPTEALKRLQRGEFQLLILDINMPQITGIDVLEFLEDHRIDVKTIVLSGETAAQTITPILRLGAYDFLPKPYAPRQLLTSVANAIERWRLEQTNAAMAVETEAYHSLHEFLVASSPDLIYVLDAQGRFRFTNQQITQIFGQTPEEVQGRHWQEILGPELAPSLNMLFDERRTGERATRQVEFEYQRGGQRPRILEFSATGMYENRDTESDHTFIGTYGVLRDVTESRLTARELTQSRMKFYGLFKDNPNASYIARISDGLLLEVNDRFQEIRASIFHGVDARCDDFLFPNPGAREAFLWQLNLTPKNNSIILEREGPSGLRYLELTAKLLTLNSELCMLATVRDRTEERRAEQDRLDLQVRLQQASKMEAIGQLAGGIAHDFNNILASIIGYAELIQGSHQRLTREQIHTYLEEVITAGQRARDLISQMLTFTRANRGEPKPVDIVSTINDVSRMLRAAIPSEIDILTRFGENLAAVHADPVQLQQIVINLLINARDAISGPGRIQVMVERGQQGSACAACGETCAGEHVVLSVHDSGHGIPDAVRARMFEMYFTTREPGKGTGIGLWLINNLIHEYGGHITVDSTVGQGSTFKVHLPLATDLPVTAPKPPEPPVERRGCRIAVVDDEVSVGNFIGEVLRNAAYEPVLFSDSRTALQYVQANHHHLAMLITDQNMPVLKGMDLAEQVKRIRPDLPVVLITGFTENLKNQNLRKVGIDAVLGKPFRIDELLATVALQLADGEAPPAARRRAGPLIESLDQ